MYRVFQLLRFALVGFVLIGATVLVDGTAVALGADHVRWNEFTPWLTGSLIPLSVLTVAGPTPLRHVSRQLLPLAHGRYEGDLIGDLRMLLMRTASALPITAQVRLRQVVTVFGVALILILLTRKRG